MSKKLKFVTYEDKQAVRLHDLEMLERAKQLEQKHSKRLKTRRIDKRTTIAALHVKDLDYMENVIKKKKQRLIL